MPLGMFWSLPQRSKHGVAVLRVCAEDSSVLAALPACGVARTAGAVAVEVGIDVERVEASLARLARLGVCRSLPLSGVLRWCVVRQPCPVDVVVVKGRV